ncbi:MULTISPECIES: hypothetical protein [unclassified Synechococcus]|uniref:hypothetical protein n=1 Tax=unclassified Synechococcus TaxID=2626047 RepID=UPI000829C377|nr:MULTISPECIES: hypothetical protein [unclassified Synechococcus]
MRLPSIHAPSGQLLIVVRTGIRLPTFSSQSPLQGIDLGCSLRGFNNDVDLSDSDELPPQQSDQPGGRSEDCC